VIIDIVVFSVTLMLEKVVTEETNVAVTAEGGEEGIEADMRRW